ncbi:MAG: hypothetical protein EA362_14145 [Saprospirales bacterium]|nr:MAG: hypothetical protein EA362_14145 [Saprospirales bacterium]
MKKLSFIVLLFAIFQLATAQETEISDKFILGGSVNFSISNNANPAGVGFILTPTNESKSTFFGFAPYIGKEISPKLIVGLGIDFGMGRTTTKNASFFPSPGSGEVKRNSNQIGFGVFSRHVANPDNQLSFYLQPYIQYFISNQKEFQNSNLTREAITNFLELGSGLGLMYNINDQLRATLRSGGLSYINGSWEVKDTDLGNDFSSFGLNLNLSNIFFGLEIRL